MEDGKKQLRQCVFLNKTDEKLKMDGDSMYDILIVGSGIVGSLIAYECSKYQLKVLVLDKENDVANESTMANSAIIHAGFDPAPGSLKAKLNVEGKHLYEALCQTLKVEYRKLGSLTVATNDEEVEKLKLLAKRAKENGVNVQLINGEEVLALEPNLSTQIIKGLVCEDTAIIYPWEVAIAAIETAMLNGVELKLNTEVQTIEKTESGYLVNDQYEARFIINAAGVFGDEIAKMINPNFEVDITPRRGTYFVLDKDFNAVSRVIYPTPTERGKGVLIVPTTHGNTLIGPDSELVEDKGNVATTVEAYNYIKNQLSKLLPSFPSPNVMRSFTGLRASSSYGDFYIQPDAQYETFVNVVGIDSPGLSASPAIAKYILNLIQPHVTLVERDDYQERETYVNLKVLNREQKNELIKNNPAYGRMVCRCEQITEGEIIDVIGRYAGATTVKGVKKRCRPGMGKCQGSFCEPIILQILARELNQRLDEVNYDEVGTQILIEEK